MGDLIEPSGGVLARPGEDRMPEHLPREAGIFLILIGIGGILLPGPIGAPFLLMGGLVFFPKVFRQVDEGLGRRFPQSHRRGVKQVRRFVDDLERRFPNPA